MINTHADGALAVARSIRAAELSSTETAIAAAGLLVTMLEQHRAMRLDDEVGLKAIRHATRAVTLAAELREEHIRAHGALNVDLKKLGLDEMFSKSSDPPSSEPAFDWRTFAGATEAVDPVA